jgi:hypothetical protein
MVTVCRLRAAPAFHAGNLLSMNYDRQLLSMSQEVQHWERLRMAVPYIAMEIQAQREKYRVLRDNMLMLVHDYNKVSTYVQGLHMLVHCSACARDACTSAPSSSPAVMAFSRALQAGAMCCSLVSTHINRVLLVPMAQVLTALDGEERRLFADRIRALDRRIMPGVSKLNWVADKHALEFYCKEARKHCHLADNCVTGFKAGLARIDAVCKSIAEGLLIDVEKKKMYEIAEFEAVQGRHHHMVRRCKGTFNAMPCTAPGCHTPAGQPCSAAMELP